jgi:hypothetical protein
MPQHVDKGLDPFFAPKAPTDGGLLDRPESSWTDIGRAALEQENDVYNAYQLINREQFPSVPDFNEVDELKKRGLLEQGERFLGSRSPAELDWKIQQVAREDENRRVLEAGGWAGTAAQVLSGVLSPTSAIPFYRGVTGAKAVLMGAASVFSGAAAQEAVLYANQQSRTGEEVALSLGASVILGGVLGGVAHTLSKGEYDKLVSSMDDGHGGEYISAPVRMTSDLGAMENVRLSDVGKLQEGMGAAQLSRLPIAQNPIIRGLQQWNAPAYLKEQGGSPTIRKFTAAFSQDNLTLTGNADGKAASPGGNVENLKKTYAVTAYKAHTAIEQAFVEYAKVKPGIAQTTRAQLATRREKKLSFDDFKQQITVDLWSGLQKNVAPEIRKAAEAVKRDVFDKLFKEGVEVGIYKGDEEALGDKGYASRVWNHKAIVQKRQKLAERLSTNRRNQLEKEFIGANERFVARDDADKAQRDAWTLSEEEVAQRKTILGEELKTLQDQTGPDILAADAVERDLNRVLRTLAREKKALESARVNTQEEFSLRANRLAEIEEQMLAQSRDRDMLAEIVGEDLAKYRAKVRAINKNLDNLKKAFVSVDGRMQAKLRKIEALEEQQIDSVIRVSKQIEKLRAFAKAASPAELEKAFNKFKADFNDLGEKFDSIEKKIVQVDTDNIPEVPFSLIDQQDALSARMDRFAAKMEDIDAFDRRAFEAELTGMLRDAASVATELNAKRAVRAEKLWAQANKLAPEARAARLAALDDKIANRASQFRDSWRAKGAVATHDITAAGVSVDFTEKAAEDAENIINKILGSERRLAYNDIIREERGPELARVLNIPSEEVMEFLETDIEKVIATYTRTLGADISLARVFGDIVPGQEFKELTDEKISVLQAVAAATKKDGTPRYVGEALEKQNEAIEHFYESARKDLYVMLERVRGIRGVPDDPNAWSSRAAKMVMDLNYLRFMGGVVISSIPDISRVVMRHGLMRTFQSAVIPMITDFKTIRMSQREAKLAGTALDTLLHTRMYSISDVFDDAHRGTAFERGMHFLSSRLGQWGLFDQWNSAMKQITAGVVNTRALDAIAVVMKAEAGNEKKAIEFLARNNIDAEIASTIWQQVTNGKGGGKVNGVWLPNTEAWDIADPMVAKAQRAYRAMLVGEVDATIVTPGLGKPNWTDASTVGRMLAQFKSYGMVSTQKVLMANLQQHDAAAVNGIMLSMGLGALSYFLYAIAAGGRTEEDMRNAGLDKWADEMISRSGVTGVFDSVQRIAEKLPIARDYATFSGSASTRRGNGDLVEAALGPSFDLLERAVRVIDGVDEPTKATLHSLRLMLPLQNLFFFRQQLDKIEAAAPLPDRRQQ